MQIDVPVLIEELEKLSRSVRLDYNLEDDVLRSVIKQEVYTLVDAIVVAFKKAKVEE